MVEAADSCSADARVELRRIETGAREREKEGKNTLNSIEARSDDDAHDDADADDHASPGGAA